MIRVQTSYTNSRYFNNQKEIAEFLNIKNSSKKSIEARCRKFNYTVEWDD